MAFLRALFLLLLLISGGCFVYFLATGQQRYKHYGLRVMRWTVVAAFVFFAVLILERTI